MKAWIEEYKKLAQGYKLEEKNLIHSYLTEDFHLNKIYSSLLKEEVELERKTLEGTIKQLKLSIDDLYSYFKGQNKTKNFEIRQKIFKIDEVIGKNRMEFKSKFENLLNEEEELERELSQFELKFEKLEEGEEENFESEKEKDSSNDYQEENMKAKINKKVNINSNSERIEEFISHVMNSANVVFDDFPIESIAKIIQKVTISELEMLREKTKLIELIIDKQLGGFTLSWQPRDHQEFLKLRASHNGKINTYEFLNDLENSLPFIPRSELKNHIKCYNKYFQLYELKKLLISQFKELKISQDAKEKQEILEKLTEDKRPQTAVVNSTKFKESEKEKLLEWKKKKLQEKKEQYEEQLKLKQEMKEKEKQKYAERVMRNRCMLEEYNQKKLEESEKQTMVTNKSQIGIGTSFSKIDLERIKEKNEKLVERKMMIVKSKSLNMIKKAENYMKYKIKKMEKLEKMPAKVTEATELYQIKQRKKHDYQNDPRREASTMANNVLGRMTRAIPEWRKSLI